MESKQNGEAAPAKGRRRLLTRLLCWALGLGLLGGLGMVGTALGIYFYLAEDLPKIDSLGDYRPPVISTVYSDDNRKIGEFYTERRIVMPLDQIPEMLRQAFVAAEDSRFYQHRGIDLISIGRAFFKNLEAGSIVQGGSTITQQVTKSFLLTPERSYNRKIKEAILAYRIDRAFSKDEILFLYLNQIYLGHGAYGVGAAAENYFAKSVGELNLAECAVLAGLPQAPSRDSPFHHPDRARQRQIYVLNRMVEEGYITNIQATAAINTELNVKPRRNWFSEEVPIYTEHVRRYVVERYGAERLLNDGLQIYTAVNIEMQKCARKEVDTGLRALDKRQGYRGPIDHLAPETVAAWIEGRAAQADAPPAVGSILEAVVLEVDDAAARVTVDMGRAQGVIGLEDMRWARKPDPSVAYHQARLGQPSNAVRPGDVIRVAVKQVGQGDRPWILTLEQDPKVEAALLCIEAGTGHVKTMIGGRDFAASQFNRAIQSRRQPGSAFKPIIYAAAIDKGYTPATVLIDSPVVLQDQARDFSWKPRNYGQKFYGPTTLRRALAKSRNVVTVKILSDIGIDYAIDYARKLGIEAPLARDLSIALGSSGVSLLELVKAYAVFSNLGYRVEPVFVTRILDRDGNVLEQAQPERQKVIESTTAYLMTSLLEGVIQQGTGYRVKALKRPVAGKTGTTDDLYDAWFVGYTPRYVSGVWVGFDDESSLGRGETGSRAASPIWLGFMQAVLKDKPVQIFTVPEGVVFSKIDADTGLLPIPESKETIFECFKEGTVPTETTRRPDAIDKPEEFYKSDI